jgi:hypothetical protein
MIILKVAAWQALALSASMLAAGTRVEVPVYPVL